MCNSDGIALGQMCFSLVCNVKKNIIQQSFK